ncbi:MAG: PHP domain-containing protein, partial [Victivallales bacterium]|nr:PHP domain-containing protein [Victivallales bacterium]
MKIVNDYHMHTKLSPCSGDQEATIENFVNALAAKGFKSICITDHYWTRPENIRENNPDLKGPFPETLRQILENKKMVESTDFPLKVLVGAEIETYSPDCIGGTLELKEMLDVVLLPTDHFHLTSIIQQPEDHSFAGWGRHMMKFFIAGAKSRVGHVLAHPFVP